MNQAGQTLSNIWNQFHNNLFPVLHDELGKLIPRQQKLVQAIDIAQVDRHFPYRGSIPGRPQSNRAAIAREKPEKPPKPVKEKKKRGRPKKGEERPKELARLEKQSAGMPLKTMLDDLPCACTFDVVT